MQFVRRLFLVQMQNERRVMTPDIVSKEQLRRNVNLA